MSPMTSVPLQVCVPSLRCVLFNNT